MASRVAVAGVVNVQQTIPIDGFPLAYSPVRYLNRPLRLDVGGVGCNVARGLSMLGSDVRLASLLGDDDAGRLARAVLAREGLLGRGVLGTGETAQSAVLVDPRGRRQISTDLKNLPTATYPPRVFEQLIDGAALAVISTIGFARGLLPVAEAAGVPIAVDLQTTSGLDDAYAQDWLDAASVVFCSAENLSVEPAVFAREVLTRGPAQVVVVGMGEQGCLLVADGRAPRVVRAVAPYGVADTTGSGDALFAGFLHYWLATGDADRAADHAVLVAGWTVGFPGTGRYPTAAQVHKLHTDMW